MKIFENKSILKKVAIILVIITIFGFCLSGNVEAKDGEKGGKLLSPIADLLIFLSDGIMDVIHDVIYKQGSSTIEIDLASRFSEWVAYWNCSSSSFCSYSCCNSSNWWCCCGINTISFNS